MDLTDIPETMRVVAQARTLAGTAVIRDPAMSIHALMRQLWAGWDVRWCRISNIFDSMLFDSIGWDRAYLFTHPGGESVLLATIARREGVMSSPPLVSWSIPHTRARLLTEAFSLHMCAAPTLGGLKAWADNRDGVFSAPERSEDIRDAAFRALLVDTCTGSSSGFHVFDSWNASSGTGPDTSAVLDGVTARLDELESTSLQAGIQPVLSWLFAGWKVTVKETPKPYGVREPVPGAVDSSPEALVCAEHPSGMLLFGSLHAYRVGVPDSFWDDFQGRKALLAAFLEDATLSGNVNALWDEFLSEVEAVGSHSSAENWRARMMPHYEFLREVTPSDELPRWDLLVSLSRFAGTHESP